MISKHSAHLTPMPFGIRTWLWRYTYLLLLISLLWHRQAIFESKGDKFSSSAECRIRTQRVSETQYSADWMPADKPTELSRIKLKNLNSTARPYDQRAFSLPDPTAIWHSHLALVIYIFVVVNFDTLAQASDFRIERRQVVFLCWMQDSNPEGLWNPIFSRLNACWQTDWAIEDQAKKKLNSTARPYDQRAFSPPDPTAIWHSHMALAIYMFVVVNFDALAQASDIRIERRQVVFLCWMQDSNPEGLWNPIFSRLNACWQTDWAIEDQAKKNWTRQPVPMISKHSAHLTPLPFGIRTWLWRYTYLLLLISMLWHRQAIFESKGDKLSSSAECRIRTQRVSETQSSADWMPADKPTELSRIKLKNLNSTARPYGQQAFSPPDPTATWHSHLALAIYIFVVVNFDALAQASDFLIERRQVVFLCWMQDSNPEGLWNPVFSRLNACWPTDWAIEDQAIKTWTRQPVPMISKHSAHLTPLPFGIRTWLWRYTYLLLLISMLWHRQAIFESKGDKFSSSAECRIRTQRVSETQSSADWMPADKPTELSRIKLKKNWTRQPVPMISEHSAHLTPLPFGIRTWLWRYICLLLLISMLWHRQAIFESKGDKLSSSAECRIRTQRVSETQSSADWMPADKPTELSRIKLKKIELDSPSLWSASIQPTWPHCHLAFAPGSGDIHICCC